MTNQQTTWGIWCTTSGGVTGHREAWAKKDGKPQTFATEAEAAAKAAEWRANSRHTEAEAVAQAAEWRANPRHSFATITYQARPYDGGLEVA